MALRVPGVGFAVRRWAALAVGLPLGVWLGAQGVRADAPAPNPSPTPAYETTDYRFASGDVQLVGRLFRPHVASSTPLVLLVQGSDYDDANNSAYWRLLATTFAQSGVAAFSFNKRGVGGSGGAQTDDFDTQARDVAAACAFAATLPGIDRARLGYYGISQAGWIVPRAIRTCPAAFVILVSPAGVPPAVSDDVYLLGQFYAAGMNAQESAAALHLHDVLASYYRTGDGYEAAQRLVDAATKTTWFAKFQAVAFRQDVPDSHRLPDPAELAAIDRRDPTQNAFYHDANTWRVDPALYRSIAAPVLYVYGGRDELIPVEESMSIFQSAMRDNSNPDVTFRVFERADHSIQDGPHLLPGYREYLAAWIVKHTAGGGRQ
jgi:alpha-beta hydrolase superfamily lysophospholipase